LPERLREIKRNPVFLVKAALISNHDSNTHLHDRPEGKGMNLLWMMTDQIRADCLGFMGHPLAQTPHLDRLAADSIVFAFFWP
jgi:hypothetical protein